MSEAKYYNPANYTMVHNRYLARLRAHEGKHKHPDDAHCVWALDEHDGSYDTSCGNKFQFVADGPEENGCVYCCYCGRIIGAVGQPEERPEGATDSAQPSASATKVDA